MHIHQLSKTSRLLVTKEFGQRTVKYQKKGPVCWETVLEKRFSDEEKVNIIEEMEREVKMAEQAEI